MGAGQSSDEGALYEACFRGDLKRIGELLKKKVVPDRALGHLGWSALHAAAYHGPIRAVQLLLAHGASTNPVNADGLTPLTLALSAHHFDIASVLADAGGVVSGNTSQFWDKTMAVSVSHPRGKPDLARLLAVGRANPNVLNNEGRPPISEAMSRGLVEVALALCDAPALDANLLDSTGAAPLHYAAETGSLAIGRVLIEKGADPCAKIQDGTTPAVFAVEQDHVEFLKFLLVMAPQCAAVVNTANWTLLHHCAAFERLECMQEVLRRLAPGSSLVNARTENGSTALHIAAGNGVLEMVRALIAAGAEVSAFTNDHVTPLHKSAFFGHVEVSRYLLKSGADVNVESTEGWTALHCASQANHPAVVELLLSYGASVHATNTANMTPLDLSIGHDAHEVAHVLLDVNAPHDRDAAALALLEGAAAGDERHASLLERIAPSSKKPAADDAVSVGGASTVGGGGSAMAVSFGAGSVSGGAATSMTASAGARPKTEAEMRNDSLLSAARHGSVPKIKALLAQGADLNATTSTGVTPLFLAVSHGHDNAAIELVTAGARLTHSPAERAAESRATSGATFLHRAIARGEDSRLEFLLELYPDLGVADGDGNTPLHVAAYLNSVSYVATILRSGRAAINARNYLGQSPLHRALRSPDALALLVGAGADVAVRDVRGRTVLSLLAEAQDAAGLSLVLGAGADPNARDGEGRTALHWVCLAATPMVLRPDVSVDLSRDAGVLAAKALVAAGAGVDERCGGNSGWALLFAVTSGNEPLVRYLITLGAALAMQTADGRTALDVARSSNLALAAVVEAACRERNVSVSAAPSSASGGGGGGGAGDAGMAAFMLEWSAWKARVESLEAQNAQLRQELRALRKHAVANGTAGAASSVRSRGEADGVVAELSRASRKARGHTRARDDSRTRD